MLLVTLSATGIAHASEYSSVAFFGDSLTDGGYFKPFVDKQQSGQFTTNPDNTWATPLAEQLGLSATPNVLGSSVKGNNYAIGGARAGKAANIRGANVASARSQVDSYLTDNKVDSKGLYSVWIGANDLLAVVNDVPNANSIITSAVTDEVATIQKLHDNGANYILVPNIPDVGLTPMLNGLGPTLQAFGTGLSTQYNDALYTGVKGTGANIIPLDTYSLLQKVAANPSAYGFTNVKDKACGNVSSLECGRSDLVQQGAENSYFFADSVHPTGRAHRMIADYANAVVTAPSQVGVLPHIATQSALATTERLQTHINQLQNQSTQNQSNQINALQYKKGPTVWASADVNALNVAGFDSSGNYQLLLGMDFPHSTDSNAVSGIYGNISQSELDNNVRTGINQLDLDEYGVGLYHSNKFGNVLLDGALGYGSLDLFLNRKVSLDNHIENFKSDVNGKRYYATLKAGYPMQMASMTQFANTTLTPYLAATVNRVQIDAIKEKDLTNPIGMQFDEQKYNTVYGTLGVKASSRLSDTLDVFGDVHYQKQLDNDRKGVTARSNTMLYMPFTTPTTDIDEDSFGVSLGLSRQFGAVNANAGVSHTRGDNDDATSVFVGLSSSF